MRLSLMAFQTAAEVKSLPSVSTKNAHKIDEINSDVCTASESLASALILSREQMVVKAPEVDIMSFPALSAVWIDESIIRNPATRFVDTLDLRRN